MLARGLFLIFGVVAGLVGYAGLDYYNEDQPDVTVKADVGLPAEDAKEALKATKEAAESTEELADTTENLAEEQDELAQQMRLDLNRIADTVQKAEKLANAAESLRANQEEVVKLVAALTELNLQFRTAIEAAEKKGFLAGAVAREKELRRDYDLVPPAEYKDLKEKALRSEVLQDATPAADKSLVAATLVPKQIVAALDEYRQLEARHEALYTISLRLSDLKPLCKADPALLRGLTDLEKEVKSDLAALHKRMQAIRR